MSRRLKKFLVISAILLVLAVIFSLVYLNSRSFALRAQTWMVDWMESRWQVEVEVDRLDLDLFSLRARLTGLRIFQRPRAYPEPALQFDSVVVDAPLSVLYSDSLRLQKVELVRPVLRLRSVEGQPFNLRAMFAPASSGATGTGFDLGALSVEELRIDQGRLIYNDRVLPITTTRFGFRGNIESGQARGSYQGRLALSGLDLESEKIVIPAADVSLSLEGDMDSIDVLRLELTSAPLQVALDGQVSDFSDFAYRFQARIEARAEDLTRAGFLDTLERAPLTSQGTVSGRGREFAYIGTVKSPKVTALGLDFENISADVNVDLQKADFSNLKGRLRGGEISASGRLAISEEERTDIQARIRETRLDGYHRLLTGRADAFISVNWPGRSWEEMRGRGRSSYQVEVQLSSLDPRLPVLPLQGDAGIRIQGRTLHLDNGQARGEGLALDYTLRLDPDLAYSAQADLEAQWGNELLQAALIEFADQLPPQLQDRLALRGLLRLQAQVKGQGQDFNVESLLLPTEVLWQDQPMGRLSAQTLWTPQVLHIEEFDL
ncbi:MAG TPA: hypothetical protein VLV83_26720, partial [Acidobacteriota bacterium]|nr:hypothetical protein [Acidobacteriota bacterium]